MNEGDDGPFQVCQSYKFGVNNEILRVMNDFARQMYYYYEMIVEWTDYFQKESGPPS